MECIADFSCWENKIAKLAPIATASIALIAAIIALGAVWAQMHIARRRASIDFFLKTEFDKEAIELYNTFNEHAPSMPSIPDRRDPTRKHYDDICSFLTICELIAVGVRKRAFSKSVSFDYWGNVIPKSYRTAERLISEIRNNPEEGSKDTYIDLEKLAKRWDKEGMTQLTLWRGLWRVWIIGTVAWAIWTFWKSDPQCLVYLIKPPVQETGSVTLPMPPWCYYRDFKYYLELLFSMFGWPVLIGILLFASRWAIAGFSKREGS